MGEVPWSADLFDQIAFWTGEELVVAGGNNHRDETRISFATSTYSFSFETMQWRELAPLSVPGYDGVFGATGAWVGSSWSGLAYPCRSGPTPGQLAFETCDPDPVGLHWTPEAGWVEPAFGVVPEGARAFAGFAALSPIGVSGSTLMLAAPGGMLTTDSESADAAAWRFTPWPTGLGVVFPRAACLVDGQILVLTTDLPVEQSEVGFGLPQNVSVAVLSAEGLEPLGNQDFGERQEQPITQCLPERALLFQTSTGAYPPLPVERVTPEGSTPWAGPTTGLNRASVGEGTDVGTGVFVGNPLVGIYIDQVTGETTELAPISSTKVRVWTGESLLVVTQVSNQLMALLPTPSWDASSEYLFPEPVDEP